ncbi:MAG: IS1380 family transposase [Bdellovibrionales bacterium]|nr:IS1380 family transposase [Bdellovibrionales bacterium]
MKESCRVVASHVNTGTAKSAGSSSGTQGREFRHPKLSVTAEKSDGTPYGGLSLAQSLSRVLRIPSRIDSGMSVLHSYRPYRDSDHILTHVYNLFIGGSAIEDIGYLQGSEAVCRMLGTKRIPDPTTAGDFLRRFGHQELRDFQHVIDEIHLEVWRRAYGRKKQSIACVDLDSHIHGVYGEKKEGADFTYDKRYGYHPLIVSLSGTGEVLRAVNRPGNSYSSDGAVEEVEELLPMLESRFQKILVRGDTAFAERELYDLLEENGHYFAICQSNHDLLQCIAEEAGEKEWKPLKRGTAAQPQKKRKRKKNLRRATARKRGKRDLKLLKEEVTEAVYQPFRSEFDYRLIMIRKQVEESHQGQLFTHYRYRFILTNLPEQVSPAEVVRLTYERCDQENVIEQLKNGISGMRMPTGSLAANAAYLICARLAHNLKSWLCMLALPKEVIRWQWKRFRMAYVYFSARVIWKARQTLVRVSDAHRFSSQITRAFARLQI